MATFVEIRPVEHATKKTTFIRIDDDLRVTTRIEEQGKSTDDTAWNFTGVNEGDYLTAAEAGGDPIAYVNVTKLGTDARAVISVNAYYAADEADTVPNAGIYWYPWKTQVDREALFRASKGEEDPKEGVPALAPDISEGQVQTFPITILNITNTATAGALPGSNTAAVSFTQASLYTRLGSTEARRNYLKRLLLDTHIDNPDFARWRAGYRITTTSQNWTNWNLMPRYYLAWQELMARVISNNANLEDTSNPTTVGERKFNLLVGELSLPGYEILSYTLWATFTYMMPTADISDKSAWKFVRMGSVGTVSPYTYVKPAIPTRSDGGDQWGWDRTARSGRGFYWETPEIVTATGVTIPNTMFWADWLRA